MTGTSSRGQCRALSIPPETTADGNVDEDDGEEEQCSASAPDSLCSSVHNRIETCTLSVDPSRRFLEKVDLDGGHQVETQERKTIMVEHTGIAETLTVIRRPVCFKRQRERVDQCF